MAKSAQQPHHCQLVTTKSSLSSHHHQVAAGTTHHGWPENWAGGQANRCAERRWWLHIFSPTAAATTKLRAEGVPFSHTHHHCCYTCSSGVCENGTTPEAVPFCTLPTHSLACRALSPASHGCPYREVAVCCPAATWQR